MISIAGKVGFDLRRISGEPMKIGQRDRTITFRAAHMNNGLKCRKRHAQIGRMHGNAGLAPTQNRVHAVEAAYRVAA